MNKVKPGGGPKPSRPHGGAIILGGHETAALPRSRGALRSLRRTDRGRHGPAASRLSSYPSRERPHCQRQGGALCGELHGAASGVPRHLLGLHQHRLSSCSGLLSGLRSQTAEGPLPGQPGKYMLAVRFTPFDPKLPFRSSKEFGRGAMLFGLQGTNSRVLDDGEVIQPHCPYLLRRHARLLCSSDADVCAFGADSVLGLIGTQFLSRRFPPVIG
jgi:hypothetical protein